MEAIGHAGTCLGILSSEGVVLAAERRNTNKLLDEVFHSEKIYKLNEDMVRGSYSYCFCSNFYCCPDPTLIVALLLLLLLLLLFSAALLTAAPTTTQARAAT